MLRTLLLLSVVSTLSCRAQAPAKKPEPLPTIIVQEPIDCYLPTKPEPYTLSGVCLEIEDMAKLATYHIEAEAWMAAASACLVRMVKH